jgi:hypothetical protein
LSGVLYSFLSADKGSEIDRDLIQRHFHSAQPAMEILKIFLYPEIMFSPGGSDVGDNEMQPLWEAGHDHPGWGQADDLL